MIKKGTGIHGGPVTIKAVASRRDLKEFVEFHNKLYEGNAYWVPPLVQDEMNTLSRRNPAFEHCEAQYWLAYKNGAVAGRIAGIINHRYIKKWGNPLARFGWIDFIDDPQVSKALLKTVEKWAEEKGMTGLHGPLGFSDMDKEGILVDGFEELGNPACFYSYPYYRRHLEMNGFRKDADWVGFEIIRHKWYDAVPEEIEDICGRILKDNQLTLLTTKTKKDFWALGSGIFELYNSAYKDLYGWVPLTDRQVDQYLRQYFSFIDMDYVIAILDGDRKVAAFAIAMPSLGPALKKSGGRLFPFGFIHLLKALKKSNKSVDLLMVGVRPELHDAGLGTVLVAELSKQILKNGITRIETTHQLESNTKMVGTWKYFEARQHKRLRCFIKDIE